MVRKLFFLILNMSTTATIVILFVLGARLLLKRFPKVFSYALWGVVLFRLLCPLSLESMFSLIPEPPRTLSRDAFIVKAPQEEATIVEVEVQDAGSTTIPQQLLLEEEKETFLHPFLKHVEWIWLGGVVILLTYSIVSLRELKGWLKGAIQETDQIYLVDQISTPFVLGMLRPKIYLPTHLSQEERQYLLLHEQIHIRRFDPLLRAISYLALILHWFNPFVWLAFYLSGKDMEMACDEAVIQELGSGVKKQYSNSLLSLSIGSLGMGGAPLAFGEGNPKGRIKNVLKFKTPPLWVTGVALVAVATLGVSLMTNPRAKTTFQGASYEVKEILYDAPMYSFTFRPETAPQFCVSSDFVLFMKKWDDTDWYMLGDLLPYEINKKELKALFVESYLEELDQLDQIKHIYRTVQEDEHKTFYMVLELKNGDVLMAIGYNHDTPLIRWLLQLRPLPSTEAEALWSHRTPYIGDNSAVGNIVNQLEFPEGIPVAYFTLHSLAEPYGITIQLDGSQLALDTEMDLKLQKSLLANASILFSLVENLDYVIFSMEHGDADSSQLQYTREWAESIVGSDLWQESKTLSSFERLLDRIYSHIDSAIQPIEEIES